MLSFQHLGDNSDSLVWSKHEVIFPWRNSAFGSWWDKVVFLGYLILFPRHRCSCLCLHGSATLWKKWRGQPQYSTSLFILGPCLDPIFPCCHRDRILHVYLSGKWSGWCFVFDIYSGLMGSRFRIFTQLASSCLCAC